MEKQNSPVRRDAVTGNNTERRERAALNDMLLRKNITKKMLGKKIQSKI